MIEIKAEFFGNQCDSIIRRLSKAAYLSKTGMRAIGMDRAESLNLTLYYQQQNSKSVSRCQFLRIIDVIDYMFKHGCQAPKELNDHSIAFFFKEGLHRLKRDTKKIQNIYESIKAYQPNFIDKTSCI